MQVVCQGPTGGMGAWGGGGLYYWLTGGHSARLPINADRRLIKHNWSNFLMSNNPKYRPSLTLAEIEALLEVAESWIDTLANPLPHLGSAIRTLKLTVMKANLGVTQPAYVPTGTKPGPVSQRNIVMADETPALKDTPEDWSKAYTEWKFYSSLGTAAPNLTIEYANKWVNHCRTNNIPLE